MTIREWESFKGRGKVGVGRARIVVAYNSDGWPANEGRQDGFECCLGPGPMQPCSDAVGEFAGPNWRNLPGPVWRVDRYERHARYRAHYCDKDLPDKYRPAEVAS